MSLKLYYKEDDVFSEISESRDFSNPLETIHDGKEGDIQIKQVFVKNDDDAKWYSNIIITPRDLVDANPYGDIIYTETGWGVKLIYADDEPSELEWSDTNWGEEIIIDNIGSDLSADISVYHSFWFLITCPPNTNAQVKTDIILNVSYTENAVTL